MRSFQSFVTNVKTFYYKGWNIAFIELHVELAKNIKNIWHSLNFLLAYITLEEHFIISITFTLNL